MNGRVLRGGLIAVLLCGAIDTEGYRCTSFAQENQHSRLPPSRASHSDPPPERRSSGLTFADLESIAVRSNPTLAQASAGIDQQRGAWLQAGLYPNPQAGYIRSDASQAGQPQANGVFVSQEIVTAGKLRYARAVEAREIERLRWERQAQYLRVVNDLQIRFYEVLGAQRTVTVSEDLYRLAAEGQSIAEDLLRQKQVSRSDVLQARVQRNLADSALQDAKYRYEAAWRQLTTVMGCLDMPPTPLDGELGGPTPDLDFDRCFQQLVAGSPQLRAAEAEFAHARSELAREQANRVPNLTVQVVTEYDRVSQSTNVNSLIAAPIPFYNRNQGNILHAQADIRAANAEIERVRLVLHDQLSDSFRRYLTARNQVERLEKKILPDVKENLSLTTEGYRQGEFGSLQVLAARQIYAQTSLAYIESLATLRKVLVEIDGLQLTGGLNPATLGAALQTSPGGFQQRGLQSQLQDNSSKPVLSPAIQTLGP